VRRVKHVSARRYYELQLGHAQDVEDRIDSSLLYVDRVVVDTNSRESSRPLVKTIDLIDSDRVSKAVIVGDPGVGKSTFVRHVMFTLAQRDDACLAPILINCRDYASSGWSKSITEFISASLRVEFTLDTRDDAVDDLLTAGAACVVFDGVDELIDLKLRREIIRRIESFTTAYPFVTVLCSTRKVGFSQAKFDSTFKLLELSEFSYDEFKQYVTRWFALTNRSDGEREAFLRESVDVKDIRQNPLMVSLLCTLYRARGHIPRNRRQVYRDCADLLFQRWDAMRHVPQPFDHRQYGNRLMQELV